MPPMQSLQLRYRALGAYCLSVICSPEGPLEMPKPAPSATRDAWPLPRLRSTLSPHSPVTLGPVRACLSYDDFSENPWDASDCFCPGLFAVRDGYVQSLGDEDVTDPLSLLSGWQMSRHWRAIAALLDLDPDDHDAEARDDARHWRLPLPQARRDLFAARLRDLQSEARHGGAYSRALRTWFDALAGLYALAGIPAERFERHGYSQGDALSVLLVWTPTFVARTGVTTDRARALEDMSSQADTLNHWVLGDCWSWTVEDTATDDVLDACCGYVGPCNDPYMVGEIADALARGWSAALGRVLASIGAAAVTAAGPYSPVP